MSLRDAAPLFLDAIAQWKYRHCGTNIFVPPEEAPRADA